MGRMQRWTSPLWSPWVVVVVVEVTQIISPSGPRFLSRSPSDVHNCFVPTPHSLFLFLPSFSKSSRPPLCFVPPLQRATMLVGSLQLALVSHFVPLHLSLHQLSRLFSFLLFLSHLSILSLSFHTSPTLFLPLSFLTCSHLENHMRRLVNLTCHLTQVQSTEVLFSQLETLCSSPKRRQGR